MKKVKIFWSKILTKKKETRGGKYKNPRVFIEQGVAMLASVLHTEKAIKTSIQIINTFVSMRHYLSGSSINYIRYRKSSIINISDEKVVNTIISDVLKIIN